jgi:hypothetical protein
LNFGIPQFTDPVAEQRMLFAKINDHTIVLISAVENRAGQI